MSIPANAVLTSIQAAGTPDAYGEPSTDGDIVWTGRARAYLKRVRQSKVMQSQGQVSTTPAVNVPIRLDVLWVLDSAGPTAHLARAGADWEACTIVVEDQRTRPAVTRRFTVNAAEHRAGGTAVDNVRLELDAETVA